MVFRHLTRAGFLLVFLSGCEGPANQAVQNPATDAPEPFLADVESRVVTSEVSGREYQISVALPQDYSDSTKTYPVLYALDANGQLGTVVETARLLRLGGQLPQLLIVGIGYPVGGRQVNAGPHRIIDLFPTLIPEWIEAVKPNWPGPLPSYDSGKAPLFLRFLREELFPTIELEYRADPSDRALYGHSAGGWFGVYALLHGEGAFQRIIAGSPSLWWDNKMMFQLEEAIAEEGRTLSARIFLSVGDEEGDEAFPGTDCFCMVSNLERLVEVFERRAYDGLVWRHHVFQGENHQSVVPPTISRGLRYIYDSI